MQPNGFWRAVLFVTLAIPAAAGAPQASLVGPEPPAFREFVKRVQEYVKLHKDVPLLRTTKKSEEIAERRNALAQKIRQSRASAKPGDIFTPDAAEEFRRVTRSTFQGADAPKTRKTIREGDPVAAVPLSVNGDYPEHLPMITVPPTLLLRLPRLPAEVAYRIIGHDLVLQDVEARLIVDFIPGIVP